MGFRRNHDGSAGIPACPEPVRPRVPTMGDASGTATGWWVNASVIGPEAARATWASAARERLLAAAKDYHATVSYKELADFVQERSLVRTTQLHMHWIGD